MGGAMRAVSEAAENAERRCEAAVKGVSRVRCCVQCRISVRRGLVLAFSASEATDSCTPVASVEAEAEEIQGQRPPMGLCVRDENERPGGANRPGRVQSGIAIQRRPVRWPPIP